MIFEDKNKFPENFFFLGFFDSKHPEYFSKTVLSMYIRTIDYIVGKHLC